VLLSTEAKYIALSDCSQQCVWVRSILTELEYKFGPIHISRDNQGSITNGHLLFVMGALIL